MLFKYQIAQRIIPTQRIAAAFGQLRDIVTRRPNFRSRLSAEHDNANTLTCEATQCLNDFVDQLP